jgi:hypothetical protein
MESGEGSELKERNFFSEGAPFKLRLSECFRWQADVSSQ